MIANKELYFVNRRITLKICRSNLGYDMHPHKSKSTDSPTNTLSYGYTLKTLFLRLWPQKKSGMRWRIYAALGFLFFGKLLNICVPIIYKFAVDALTITSTSDKKFIFIPLAIILSYGAARITAQLFGELKDMLLARVEQRAIRQMALESFTHLHNLSLRFHLDRKTGALSRSIERGTAAIDTFLRFMIFNIIPTFLEIILVAFVLWFIYGGYFASVTILTLTTYVFYTIIVTEWRTKLVRFMNQIDGEANTKAIDSLLNYETVKYFCNEQHEAQRYDQSLQAYELAAVKAKESLSFLNVGQGIIISVGLIIVMIMAAQGIVNKTMTVGDFVMINMYMIQLYTPLNILGFAYREIKMALVNMEKLFLLLDEKGEIEDAPQAKSLKLKNAEVIFQNVDFSYSSKRPILKNISFEISPGKTLAIVGASGAGKSTISRLLFRFYDVTRGRILIDGQDIRFLTQQSVRSVIGIVPQDTVLFGESIYYNIAYGCPTATHEEVIQAARLAKIDDFIRELPDQYETLVGERGLKLSGGEKQRVAIARTLLKKPAIFLFDEATSALDTHTEKAIQESLKEISAHHTTLIIAHRLSTIVDADEIIVMERGQIIERGTHHNLLDQKGAYAHMWKQQQKDHRS